MDWNKFDVSSSKIFGQDVEGTKELLTLVGTLPYLDLRRILMDVTVKGASVKRKLPGELIGKILNFLVVERVKMDNVKVSASSDRGDYSLSKVLEDDRGKSWWISKDGTMPPLRSNRKGDVFLQFHLTNNASLRRVSKIYISIPTLPYGPLSVRDFCLKYSQDNGRSWIPCCASGSEATVMTVLSMVQGLQKFTLPTPVDAAIIRLICLSNQASSLPDMVIDDRFNCVGLYTVKFG